MPTHPLVALTEAFREEAEKDMRRLALNPASPEAWRRYALLLTRDRQLLFGLASPEDDNIIEISQVAHARLMKVAGPATRLIAKLAEIDTQYRAIKQPHQVDVLEHAIAALKLMDDLLETFRVSPTGGLPTPLLLVLADLINVCQGRLGRLLTPDDKVIAGAKEVSDSSGDRIRLTIHAYAASTVHRLIDSKQFRTKEEAYGLVADALEKAGFRPPGKKKTHSLSSATVRSWYEQTFTEACPFADEYKQATKAADGEPLQLLQALTTVVRSLMFKRGPRDLPS